AAVARNALRHRAGDPMQNVEVMAIEFGKRPAGRGMGETPVDRLWSKLRIGKLPDVRAAVPVAARAGLHDKARLADLPGGNELSHLAHARTVAILHAEHDDG